MLQLGVIASLTSLVHQLHEWAWVLVQALICALTLRYTGGVFRPNLRGLSVGWFQLRKGLATFVAELSPWGVMALVASFGILALSAVMQTTTPIHVHDDKTYHASRVIYWIQHQTVFPFVTHNIRQTMVPFGSELFFLWPELLTKTEWVGRLVFWLAYPLAAVGQYFLLRTLKLSCTISLVGVLILISTPLVAASAIGLKPELWSVLTLLGAAYWVASICVKSEPMKTKYFFRRIRDFEHKCSIVSGGNPSQLNSHCLVDTEFTLLRGATESPRSWDAMRDRYELVTGATGIQRRPLPSPTRARRSPENCSSRHHAQNHLHARRSVCGFTTRAARRAGLRRDSDPFQQCSNPRYLHHRGRHPVDWRG